jgi:hypothetical protein
MEHFHAFCKTLNLNSYHYLSFFVFDSCLNYKKGFKIEVLLAYTHAPIFAPQSVRGPAVVVTVRVQEGGHVPVHGQHAVTAQQHAQDRRKMDA